MSPNRGKTGRIITRPKWGSHNNRPTSIWGPYVRCTLLWQISLISASYHPCWARNRKYDRIRNILGTHTGTHFHWSARHMAWDSEAMVNSYTPNLTCINTSCHACATRNFKFDHLWNIWSSNSNCLSPIVMKFATWQWTCCMLFHAKFHGDRCMASPMLGKIGRTANMTKFVYLGFSYPFPITKQGQIWRVRVNLWPCQI